MPSVDKESFFFCQQAPRGQVDVCALPVLHACPVRGLLIAPKGPWRERAFGPSRSVCEGSLFPFSGL